VITGCTTYVLLSVCCVNSYPILSTQDYAVAGDRDSATEAYKKAEEKTAGSGPKMDLVFSVLKYVVSLHTH